MENNDDKTAVYVIFGMVKSKVLYFCVPSKFKSENIVARKRKG